MRISDWSSDVCSSDLLLGVEIEGDADVAEANRRFLVDAQGAAKVEIALDDDAAARELEVDRGGDGIQSDAGAGGQRLQQHVAGEIGRASGRERVCQYVSISVVAVSFKTNNAYTTILNVPMILLSHNI